MAIQYRSDNSHPTGAQGAAMGAQEGSIGGPWGAAGGAIGGFLDNELFGGTAYKALHKAPKVPVEPKWQDVDPATINAASIAADQAAYGRSDQHFAADHPDLVRGRNAAMASAVAALQGDHSAVTNALSQSGFDSEASKMSMDGEYGQARDLGVPLLDLEKRDRNYFQNLLGENPQRAFGMTGNDVANIRIANAGQKAVNDQALFDSRRNLYSSAVQQNYQNLAALGPIFASGLTQAMSDYTRNQKENSPYNYGTGAALGYG